MNRRLQLFIMIAFGLLLLLGCGRTKSGSDTITLLNVSYDPTREFYREYNELFARHWQEQHSQRVVVEQSHGGSGKQARSVIDGLEADVVTLATASDIDAIARLSEVLPVEWQSRLPEHSAPYYSTMVFLVRAGNPKQIHDWADLLRDDVQVITPNPKTSGAARWNYLAARSWAMDEFSGNEAAVLEAMARLYANVPVLDSGARGASNTFARAGIGDVLINWENEALLLAEDIGGSQFEIVVPSVSILAEPPVAVVEKVAARHGTAQAATAYLEFLYTPEAQELVAVHHYRPRNSEVMSKHAEVFPTLELVTVEQFGGWGRVQEEYFADGGEFDRIMVTVRGMGK